MKMTKKALSAMIAASIAATALPAAAMVSNLSTLTSNNSADANNTTPQDANTATQTDTPATEEPNPQSAAATPAVQVSASPESMFQVETNGDSVTITGFIIPAGSGANIVVPDTIGGKKVVGLKSNNKQENGGDLFRGYTAMDGAESVLTLDLSNCTSLSSINEGVFLNKTHLTNVKFPPRTFTIGKNAFRGTKLTNIDLSNCTRIGESAFSSCTGLKSITFPTDHEYIIYKSAFRGCAGLAGDLDLSQCIAIGSFAFGSQMGSLCTGITSVDLSNCKMIGNSAFYDCSGITSITWPTTSYTLSDGAFAYCTGITSIDLSNCTYISAGSNANLNAGDREAIGLAFGGCTNLTSVTWPTDKMPEIPKTCFSGCTNLKSFNSTTEGELNLTGITSVGNGSFKNCSGITSVTFPTENTYTLSDGAFQYCTGLTSIDLSNCTYISAGSNADANLMYLETIGNAFGDCTNLTSVTWPTDKMPKIPQTCFDGCQNLKTFNSDTEGELNLTGITSVGNGSFQNCSGITSVTFPTENTYTLSDGAFSGCTGLTSIDLSNCTGITPGTGNDKDGQIIIGKAFYNCENLTSVTWPTDKMPEIPQTCFNGCTSLTTFNSDTEGECNLSGITSIGDSAFSGCTNINPVISTQATTVASNAFKDCPYVAIQADTEEELINYCSSIAADSGNLKGLSSIKKVAEFSSVTGMQGLSYDIADIVNLVPDNNATYYLTASGKDGYTIQDYKTEAAYDVALKSVANGASEATAVAGDVPLTIQMPAEQYDQGRTYYLSTDTTNPIPLTEQNGYYTYSYTPTLSATDKNIVAIVSPNVTSITVSGDNAFTYGDTASTEYTATVTPADAKQAVTWSSNNESVLKFEDENSGTATIVDPGEATITATATDGSGITGTLDILVKDQPIIALQDKNAPYTGQSIAIDEAVITLASGSVYTGIQPTYSYYSDAECQTELEGGAPTNVSTYYVKASIPEQDNYAESESSVATLTITPVDVTAVPPAPEMESQTPDSITFKTVDGGTTEQGDAYSTQYGTDKDGNIEWQDSNTFTGLTPGDHTFYLRYRVNEPKTGNYTNEGCSASGEAATFTVNQLDPPAVGEGFTIDYVNETITLGAGYEAAKEASFAAGTMLNSGATIEPGKTIYVRTAATGDAIASVGTPNDIASRPETPAVPNVVQTVNMLTVTNPGNQQEYKFDKTVHSDRTAALGQWQDSPVFTDNIMAAGDTYTVTTRVKATETTFASKMVTSNITAETFPENQETLKGNTNEAGEFVWTGSDGNDYTGGYNIPTRLLIEGGDTYMVEIDWGEMLFTYNFGTWDTETLSYTDDETTLHWGTSFDGTNNKVTVINRSSDQIDTTLNLALNEDQKTPLDNLGFHLAKQNVNSTDVSNNYPTTAQTLQSGATGNSTTAYVNIGANDLTPPNDYNTKTQIGNITVTVQKTANP